VEEELDAGFWRRYARAAHTLNLVIVAIDLCYALATYSTGPNRLALVLINVAAFGGIVSAIAMVPEAKIAASPHRDVIFGSWCVAGPVLVAVAASLDGGVASPLAWLFPLAVMFTATVHRPPIVVLSAVASLTSYIVVGGVHGSLTAHPAMVAVQSGYLIALAYAGALTAHYRWTDYDTMVGITQWLSSLADRDGLTGLLNHRAFHEQLTREVAQAERDDEPLAVLVIDADHFKRVNDDHGHLVGDEVLKALAQAIVTETRAGDLCARVGGEEFCVALPRATRAEAHDVAERVRAAVAALDVAAPITVSIGVGVASGREGGATLPTAVLQRADAALYEAKRNGRNQVCELAAA
jgi:diguanylate cyclase (GGDEF)-like protein